MELAEKIEAALVAYLKAGTWPPWFNSDLILPAESAEEKSDQCILIIAEDATEEEPQYTGNFWHPVRIELQTPMGLLTATQIADDAIAPIDKHKVIADLLQSSLMADNLPTLLNAQVADFTCLAIVDRKPSRGQTENMWASGLDFRLLACVSTL